MFWKTSRVLSSEENVKSHPFKSKSKIIPPAIQILLSFPFKDLEEDLAAESNQLLDVGDVDGTNPSSKYCHVFSGKRI